MMGLPGDATLADVSALQKRKRELSDYARRIFGQRECTPVPPHPQALLPCDKALSDWARRK